MKQFFETYQSDEKLSTLLRELPWSSHLHIMSKCQTAQEREFYLNVAVHERWSVRELEQQINNALFERTIASPLKVSTLLRELHPACRIRLYCKLSWMSFTSWRNWRVGNEPS